MKERPILFSSPMVNAILAGTKTMTRRLVKASPVASDLVFAGGKMFDLRVAHHVPLALERCPYGAPGDRLWVRETMRFRDPGKRTEAWTYGADGAEVSLPVGDPNIGAMLSWAHHKEGNTCVSIHMPRWASRIDLEVTAVRVERLQDITEEDARAEGVEYAPSTPFGGGQHRGAFADLWESINGKRAPWASNPWVWCVSFKRVRP